MSAAGKTTVDFGAIPGGSNAKTTVTGQGGILAGSLVEAWIAYADSVDHSADEHAVEILRIVAGNIVPGVGFDIIVSVTDSIGGQYGVWNVNWAWL